MKQGRKLVQYWRNSLADRQFMQAQYQSSGFRKAFSLNETTIEFRVDDMNLLQSLPFEGKTYAKVAYLPFVWKRAMRHNQYQTSFKPEILALIQLKVEVSEHGFIYPIDNPIVPRDVLLPLDREAFYIGAMEVYDRYLKHHPAPVLARDETSEWEVFYQNNIANNYRKGLIKELLDAKLISKQESKTDFQQLTETLLKNRQRAREFILLRQRYNDKWNQNSCIAQDEAFKRSLHSYQAYWADYVSYIDKLIGAILASSNQLQDYERVWGSYFAANETDMVSRIADLYDYILANPLKTNSSLLLNITSLAQQTEDEVPLPTAALTKRLGHNNNLYPLADAQRQAVSALLDAQEGEVLAVNGPPGTGKTTMLLSVVSCLWVERALQKAEPPIIIASSTNNQAVTNIIDAFAKDFSKGYGTFAGRWIVGLESFGSYFSSQSKGEEALAKGYQTEQYIEGLETEGFYQEALSCYLQKAQEAFRNTHLNVKQIVEKLHQMMQDRKQQLEAFEQAYQGYHGLGQRLQKSLGLDYKVAEQRAHYLKLGLAQKQDIQEIEQCWDRYRASENILLSACSVLPFVRQRRDLKAKVFAQEQGFAKYFSLDDFDSATFEKKLMQQKSALAKQIDAVKSLEQTYQQCADVLTEISRELHPNQDLLEIDRALDTSLRFELFLLATHYWEGRWLLDMEELIDKNGLERTQWMYKNIREANWHRRMKLMPCAVMTSYMLPEYFKYRRDKKDHYLCGFIDLLIVDEAGQVSPEVAGAGFSLAEKALVIGDTQQIPPIATLSKSIDVGNLQQSGLIETQTNVDELDKLYSQLQAKGLCTHGGSVMRMAQARSRYYPEKELERGLYLYEHRRCYDDIISYCNELCYKGVLKPMRGKAKAKFIPAMGYLHIDGQCQNAQGSKRNKLEAKLIAGWIINNCERLKQEYGAKPIQEIVAVVTPFRAQAQCISAYLRKPNPRFSNLKGELAQITVGTVHALQGAEREVVLFSPTYSRHNKGSFIDSDPSMLNVAVSRAKDSFLVFGDMSLFNPSKNTPTAVLARYLLDDPEKEVIYEYQYSDAFVREDLVSKDEPIQLLKDYEQHDAFLRSVFQEAKKRIIIFSPWLIYATMQKQGYLQLLADTKLEVEIYTDKHFNTTSQNRRDKQKEQAFHDTVKQLESLGVRVIVKDNIHSKVVIKDSDTLCIGSFNWFSAQRGGRYANMEHSIVYQGERVKHEIDSFLTAVD